MKITNLKTALFGLSACLISSCAVMKNNTNSYNKIAIKQAERDSAYYRNTLNQTPLINDSNAVKEFNKIASQMQSIKENSRHDLSREILQNAEQSGIDENQTNILKGIQYISNKQAIITKQKLADQFVYEKFLKKHGISEK